MLTLQLNIYYWGKAKLLKLFPPGKVKRLLDAPGSGCDRSPLTASPIGVPGELPQSAIASPAAYNLSTERAAAAGTACDFNCFIQILCYTTKTLKAVLRA